MLSCVCGVPGLCVSTLDLFHKVRSMSLLHKDVFGSQIIDMSFCQTKALLLYQKTLFATYCYADHSVFASVNAQFTGFIVACCWPSYVQMCKLCRRTR